MISQPRNRVQAIKSKFENLNSDSTPLIIRKKSKDCDQLCKQPLVTHDFNKIRCDNDSICSETQDKENSCTDKQTSTQIDQFTSETSENCPKPNSSYLYNKSEIKRTASDTKKSLSRQSSDPGKKLHRSHAFRCDRSQKMGDSPKRHGSCHGRSESGDFILKPSDKKLSKDRLKRLGNVLEDRMRKENFISINMESNAPTDSIPDSDVPKHILDQYAKVIKPKKDNENKQDGMTDSGVSSETENNDDEKVGKIKKLMSQFEKPESSQQNLEVIKDLSISTETMKLERKNPHLKLTDTLKKALKQPLPIGPPPKKPPRSFVIPPSIQEGPAKQRKDTKKMLEKLEQVLQQREAQNQSKNIYDIAENIPSNTEKPKEVHYLCTEILDITHKTLLPNQNLSESITKCFNSLNCAIPTNSMSSLPYTRMSMHSNSNRNSIRMCCSCSNDSLDRRPNRLSTFLGEEPCSKCQTNEDKHTFKCHLNCNCKDGKSKFFVEKEHIYDVPFAINDTMRSFKRNNKYGTLNSCKIMSKSLEDLRLNDNTEEKIYDIPCEDSRPASPEGVSPTKTDFEQLRRSFENGCQSSEIKCDRILMPKSILIQNRCTKSTENIPEIKMAAVDKKFATEKKYKKRDSRLSLPKKDNNQLEIDKENLNRLMSEIYETVTAACTMDDHKPGSFPTDSHSSEESVKLTRSLTEKRKNYVRRVSSKVSYMDNKNTRYRHQTSVCSYKSEIIDNPYSTFRSWKSFRASQCNLTDKTSTSPVKTDKMADKRQLSASKCNLMDSKGNLLSMRDELDTTSVESGDSIDDKAGCMDISLPFEPRERGLFNVCLLVGYNYLRGEAYVKSVFPSQVQVPPHIENLIFPETLGSTKHDTSTDNNQCYSLVLTDEKGERSYGYCRRVLPEGATTCLPLCYCVIGKYRAPGFYYKVLQEIESHHGSSDEEITNTLQQLFDCDFPNPGEEITITNNIVNNIVNNKVNNIVNSDVKCGTTVNNGDVKCGTTVNKSDVKCGTTVNNGDVKFGTTVNNSDVKCKTLPDMRTKVNSESDLCKSESSGRLKEFLDVDNNNGSKDLLDVESKRYKTIKRPLEPRIDEDCFSVLLDTLGAGLVIKVFASLLLERKVIIICDQLSTMSLCLSALQLAVSPLVWQHPLVSCLPAALHRAALAAPLPLMAGTLPHSEHDVADHSQFDEGMLLDLNHPNKVLVYQGDEATILPASAYKTLKTALQMECKSRDAADKTRNVMISEAFLRFFVDILGDYWRFIEEGEGGGYVFNKDGFIKNASTKQNQYFLEWFTETAMFNHFIQNMLTIHSNRRNHSFTQLIDTPLPDFYEMFEERIKSRNKGKNQSDKGNYKNAVNKRVRLLKNKLRDLIA